MVYYNTNQVILNIDQDLFIGWGYSLLSHISGFFFLCVCSFTRHLTPYLPSAATYLKIAFPKHTDLPATPPRLWIVYTLLL